MDESTGQIRVKYVKDQNEFDFSPFSSSKEPKIIENQTQYIGFDRELTSEYELISSQNNNNRNNNKKSTIDFSHINNQPQLIQILEDANNSQSDIVNQTDAFQNLHSHSNSPSVKQQNLMNSG